VTGDAKHVGTRDLETTDNPAVTAARSVYTFAASGRAEHDHRRGADPSATSSTRED
jgi:hypothetical protein